MNLRDWRTMRGKTLNQVAAALGIAHARNYQRYEIGMVMPDAPMIRSIEILTEGHVSAADLVDQRMEWLRQNKPQQIPEAAE